ncbi:MAG: transglycosylase domain-containing protein, partial [Geminicoccaceae bacterium]
MLRLDLQHRYRLGCWLGRLETIAFFLSRHSILILIAAPLLVIGGIKLAGLAGMYLLHSEFTSQIERSTAVEVVDRAGVWFVLPGVLDRSVYSDGTLSPPDHRSRTPEAVPDFCWAILVALEDRRRGTIFHVGGIDLLASLAIMRDVALGKRRGASTIEMQVLRSTYNLLPGTGWISDVKRKVIEFALAPGFARFIEQHGGEPLLAQLALTHLPFGHVPGRTLHGIVDAANAT